ncbi:NADH dehydrogenase subunit 5, Involved in CO2 fixation [Richelia intracellularis]|nr:NADH dehydrogenase subunit 5, Involved in CO2 fixation [Richelia intracellularis]
MLLVLTHAVSAVLLVMSTGAIVWNSVTQDITQLGGLWSRRPVSGIAFVVGTLGLIGFPPLGSFWALLELADGLWTTKHLIYPTNIVLLIQIWIVARDKKASKQAEILSHLTTRRRYFF